MQVLSRELASGRVPRLLVVSLDGTWAGGFWSDRSTVVPNLYTLISDHENPMEVSLDGVGSGHGISNWILGGVGGMGTLSNVLKALKGLARDYRPGDRIIFIGYSRGAWAARYLALLISRIGGLPKHGDDFPYSQLYKACDNKSIWKDGVAEDLMENHECYKNVWINAVVCFDTVGSLGWPMTGVALPLRLVRHWHRKHDLISTVASNVKVAIHAVALHEPRAPFAATLMRGANVYQVGFPGNHGNLGWMDKKNPDDLICGPLAWVLQQLQTHLNLTFKEDRLVKYFPRFRPEEPVVLPNAENEEAIPTWVKSKIPRTNGVLLSIMGKSTRKPGRITSSDTMVPDIEIHSSVRLRGHGQSPNDPSIAGYHDTVDTDGTHYWAKDVHRRSWFAATLGRKDSTDSRSSSGSAQGEGENVCPSRSSSMSSTSPMATRINEAKVGPLEARLLGLTPSKVPALH